MSIGSYKSLAIPGIAKRRGATLRPTLALSFLSSSMPPSLSSGRVTNATMFDSAGNLVWAPHNLCTRGNDWQNWGGAGDAVVTEETGVFALASSPSRIQAYRLTWPNLGVPSSGCALAGQTAVNGVAATVSVYLRYVNHKWVRIACYSSNNAANQFRCWVDLETGTLGTISAGGTSSVIGAALESVGDGWVRVSVTGLNSWFNSTDAALLVATAAGDNDATRVGFGAAVLAAGCIYELNGPQAPQTWDFRFATAGSPYYGARLDCGPGGGAVKGLRIEPGRVNIQQTGNTASVTGGTNVDAPTPMLGWPARRLTADGTAGPHYTTGGGSVQAGSTPHTVSMFLRYVSAQYVQLATTISASTIDMYANFDLLNGTIASVGSAATALMVDCGNGVYWCSMSYTSVASPGGGTPTVLYIVDSALASRAAPNSLTTAVDFMLQQLEVGDGPTYPVPTFGAAASRGGEPTISLPIAEVPWSDAGSVVYARYQHALSPIQPSTHIAGWTLGNSPATNAVYVAGGFGTPAQRRVDFVSGGFNSARVVSNDAPGQEVKIAGMYAAGRTIAAKDGVLSAALTGVAAPVGMTNFNLMPTTTTSAFTGWIKEVQAYAVALSDAQLQALTS